MACSPSQIRTLCLPRLGVLDFLETSTAKARTFKEEIRSQAARADQAANADGAKKKETVAKQSPLDDTKPDVLARVTALYAQCEVNAAGLARAGELDL